jgi:hypothetical protein
MTDKVSAAEKKAMQADLKAAEAAAPSEEELREIATRVPPLVRDEEHSFVETEGQDVDAEDVAPDLTGKGYAPLYDDIDDSTIKVTRADRAKSTYERSSAFRETDLERLTDEQIKSSGLLKKATSAVHPARLAPSSDRPRQPGSTAPAAGAGSWPVHEGQLPAVMPTDGPVEDAADREVGDNGLATRLGLSKGKDGTLTRKGLSIAKNETAGAAALYLRLRQQFPSFTKEQLADEFEVQWLSGNVGGLQSHRAGEELSQHGLTEVGDDRVEITELGKLRREAPEADPRANPAAPGAPDTGLPSVNEPASVAIDDAKEPSGETVEADEEAKKLAAKFDHDGDGRPGGAPPGGNKSK